MPFREEMSRKMELGLNEAAFETCKGIVFGLYQCRISTGGALLGWAPGFPAGAASDAACILNTACKRGASFDFSEFVAEFVPEW